MPAGHGPFVIDHTAITYICAAVRYAASRWREADIGERFTVAWDLPSDARLAHAGRGRRRR